MEKENLSAKNIIEDFKFERKVSLVPLLESVHRNYAELTRFFIANGIQVSLMESCTSGLVASLITDTEGSSAIIKGAFVTYSNEAKIKNGVPAEVIQKFGVYSRETAFEMAKACRAYYNAHVGIGITGTFGNLDPANKDSFPGKVFISITDGQNNKSVELNLPENISRFESKLCVANMVYEMIFYKQNLTAANID